MGFESFGSCSISIIFPVLQRLGHRRILLHEHWTHQVQPRIAAAGWNILCWAKHLTTTGDGRKIRKGLGVWSGAVVVGLLLYVIVVLPSRQWIFGNWPWMANVWALRAAHAPVPKLHNWTLLVRSKGHFLESFYKTRVCFSMETDGFWNSMSQNNEFWISLKDVEGHVYFLVSVWGILSPKATPVCTTSQQLTGLTCSWLLLMKICGHACFYCCLLYPCAMGVLAQVRPTEFECNHWCKEISAG